MILANYQIYLYTYICIYIFGYMKTESKSRPTYFHLTSGKTNTSEKYAQQMDEMHRKLQGLQAALVNRKGLILHNNAQRHITKPTLQKLNELGYEVLPHPPYSPDLLPSDYHFFKHLHNFLQGKCFHNQ